MNEFQAALGIVQLKYVDDVRRKGKAVADHYREHLRGIKGISFLNEAASVRHKNSYFPILLSFA